MKGLLIVTTMLAALLGCHLLLYVSAVRAFGVPPGKWRTLALMLSVILALSFPVCVLSARAFGGPVFSGAFALASTWIGLAINLLIVMDLGWAVAGIWRLTRSPVPAVWIGVVAVAAALVFTAWGLWRAAYPVVTELEVPVAGLPEHWQGRRVVHLSDLHLGAIRGHGLLRQIRHHVDEIDPDLVLITGDIFDGPAGDYPSFLPGLDALAEGRPVYCVLGNHEMYNQTAPLLRQSRLRVVEDEVVDLDGLQLVGVSYPGLADEGAVEELRGQIDPRRPSILLFHTPTDIYQRTADSGFVGTYWIVDTSCTLNRELGIDLQLSGHTHAGQVMPFGWLAQLIYHGRDRNLHRDGSFHLFVSGGTGTFGPPMRTAGRSEIAWITLIGDGAD